MNCDAMFYGSVTVGERGQIVIPSEARTELGFNPGDKLLIAKHPMQHGLIVFKFESVREFFDEFVRKADELQAEKEEESK